MIDDEREETPREGKEEQMSGLLDVCTAYWVALQSWKKNRKLPSNYTTNK
jgi:hypothetical protein